MKFVSKFTHYRVVLKPGISGNKFTGDAPKAGIHVLFQDGIADVPNKETEEMMLNHKQFGTDFIEMEEGKVDPHKDTRTPNEPAHNISEVKHGSVVGNTVPKAVGGLTVDMKKSIKKHQERTLIDMLKDPKKMKELADIAGGELAKESKEKVAENPSQDGIPPNDKVVVDGAEATNAEEATPTQEK